MASALPTVKDIRQQLKSGTPASLYVLHGEEGYYLDELVKDFEALVPDDEKDFNLYVLYAPQVTPDQVVDACLRYPMMAERQVVILKEAQAVKADFINELTAYAERPNAQTVFVLVCRGAKLTGAKFLKAVGASKGVIFESRKIFDSQVGAKIEELVAGAGLTIDSKAKAMLADHVGVDLSRIVNEVRKLTLVLPPKAAITPQVVEKLIGVNKDYNNFELVDALAVRDVAKVYRIVEYFRSNPKPNPPVVTCASIFSFFSKLLMAHYAPERTESGIASAIGSRPGAQDLKRVIAAMRMYNARQTVNAISACRRFDVRSKGIGSRQDSYDLLRELVFGILN